MCRVKYQTSACDAKIGTQSALKLMVNEGVDVLIGPNCSAGEFTCVLLMYQSLITVPYSTIVTKQLILCVGIMTCNILPRRPKDNNQLTTIGVLICSIILKQPSLILLIYCNYSRSLGLLTEQD